MAHDPWSSRAVSRACSSLDAHAQKRSGSAAFGDCGGNFRGLDVEGVGRAAHATREAISCATPIFGGARKYPGSADASHDAGSSPAKRPRLAALLDACGLKPSQSETISGLPKTIEECQRLCFVMVERIELQRDIRRRAELNRKLHKQLAEKQAEVRALRAKLKTRGCSTPHEIV
eukprot:TRINITY_DN50388_c0_g1_i1.p1 TRINITY_DN50388_c0_g1~~TRINITY_DN50388_c0_g1_i1.p1  ORF type:complete len:175 (+),score=23.70 TRINITY_DN50388_c0_g1_i1:79-603(+)